METRENWSEKKCPHSGLHADISAVMVGGWKQKVQVKFINNPNGTNSDIFNV